MNKKILLEKIKDNFPQLMIKKIKLLTHGWNDIVLIVNDRVVFTFPKEQQESRDQLQKELLFLPLLQERVKIDIPNFQYIPTDKSFAGYPLIPGRPLSRTHYKTLSKSQKTILAKQIAFFLQQLHGFSIPLAQKCHVGYAWSYDEARKWHDEHNVVLFKKLSKKEALVLGSHVEAIKKINIHFTPTVTHHDLTIEHIIFDYQRNRLSGIIDFGDVQISDPACDVGKLWEYGEDFVDLLLYHYEPKDKHFKARAWIEFVNLCMMNLYFGVTMKRKDYWRSGSQIFKAKMFV